MLNLAITVESDSGQRRDLVMRASGSQTVADLAAHLAQYLGLPPAAPSDGSAGAYALHVRRTGACLDPSTRLAEADLLEGDILRLAARGVPGSEFTVPSERSTRNPEPGTRNPELSNLVLSAFCRYASPNIGVHGVWAKVAGRSSAVTSSAS
jgi:hypothetical protein